MKTQKPVFIVIALVFFILGMTTKNYFYIIPAVLFIIAGLIQKNRDNN